MQSFPPSRHDEILGRLLAERAHVWQAERGVPRIIARLKTELWAHWQAARELEARRAKFPLRNTDRALLIFTSATMTLAALGWLLLQIPMRELAGALLSAAVLFGPVFLVLTILDLVRPTRTWRLWLSLSFALASVVVAALAFYAIIHH